MNHEQGSRTTKGPEALRIVTLSGVTLSIVLGGVATHSPDALATTNGDEPTPPNKIFTNPRENSGATGTQIAASNLAAFLANRAAGVTAASTQHNLPPNKTEIQKTPPQALATKDQTPAPRARLPEATAIETLSSAEAGNTEGYEPLLKLIREAESSNNYNAYYGNANNIKIKFTEMPIAEVLDWQNKYVKNGSPSSAVGSYQFLGKTLKSLVENDPSLSMQSKLNEATQDKLAITLLEIRGVKEYEQGKISATELAANLAKEWASLPRMTGGNPDASYYAGDGLNASSVKRSEILEAIKSSRPLKKSDQPTQPTPEENPTPTDTENQQIRAEATPQPPRSISIKITRGEKPKTQKPRQNRTSGQSPTVFNIADSMRKRVPSSEPVDSNDTANGEPEFKIKAIDNSGTKQDTPEQDKTSESDRSPRHESPTKVEDPDTGAKIKIVVTETEERQTVDIEQDTVPVEVPPTESSPNVATPESERQQPAQEAKYTPETWKVAQNHKGGIDKKSAEWKEWKGKLGANGNTDSPYLMPINVGYEVAHQDNRLNKHGGGNKFHPNAAKSLEAMIHAFNEASPGAYLTPGASFRSGEAQKLAWENYINKGGSLAAKPVFDEKGNFVAGTSNHGWGLATDMRVSTVKGEMGDTIKRGVKNFDKYYEWLRENGPKYGWVNPYKMRPEIANGSKDEEPWHLQYVGDLTVHKS